MGQIEKDIDAGLYGRDANTPEEMLDAAEDHYTPIFMDALPTGSVSGKKSDKRSEEEITAEDERWLADLSGMNGEEAKKEAMGYMRGGETENGLKVRGINEEESALMFLGRTGTPSSGKSKTGRIEVTSIKGYKGEDENGKSFVDEVESTEYLDIENMSDEEKLKFKRAADKKKTRYKGVRDEFSNVKDANNL
jgi:hypothetical protein